MIKTVDLMNAVEFLQKVFVGREQEETLVRTISALQHEIERRANERKRTG